jgi:hypothetical protein
MMNFDERILSGNPLQRFGSGLELELEPTREFEPVANTRCEVPSEPYGPSGTPSYCSRKLGLLQMNIVFKIPHNHISCGIFSYKLLSFCTISINA